MQMAKQQGGEGGGRGATADTKKSRKGTVIEVYTADRLEQGKHSSNNVLKVNIQDKTALQETLNVSLRSPQLISTSFEVDHLRSKPCVSPRQLAGAVKPWLPFQKLANRIISRRTRAASVLALSGVFQKSQSLSILPPMFGTNWKIKDIKRSHLKLSC